MVRGHAAACNGFCEVANWETMNIPSIGSLVTRNPGIRSRSLGVMTGMLAVVILSSPAFAEVILVAGATGRLGSQIVREVADSGYQVRGLTRDPESARRTLGEQYEWIKGDLRDQQSIRLAMGNVDWVVSAVGALRPDGPNGPQFVDYEGVVGLIDSAVEAQVQHFVLISSIGVSQRFHLLNLTFGNVLKWKALAEAHLRSSGLSYTIIRPGGLRPGPQGIEGLALEQGDKKGGSYVYIPDVAALVAETVGNPDLMNKTFEVLNDRETAPDLWRQEFDRLKRD
jgi:uncharacterized protein YbjT (DUF2867 family)